MLLLGAVPIAQAEEPTAYTPIDPIIIAGNDDFTPENGVTGGEGTQDSPYIIEKWTINASLANGSAGGITISHTDAHFIIRDVIVQDGGDLYCGIWLSNVKNSRIEQTVLTDNYEGITLNSTSDTHITDNDIRGSVFSGIYLIASERIRAEGNDIGNSTYGVYLCCCAHSVLAGNNVTADDKAIIADESEDLTIEGNDISDSDYGIYFDNASDCAVIGNSITGNGCGVYLSPGCTDITIEDNLFAENDISISGAAEENDGTNHGLVLGVAAGTVVLVALVALIITRWKRAGR